MLHNFDIHEGVNLTKACETYYTRFYLIGLRFLKKNQVLKSSKV